MPAPSFAAADPARYMPTQLIAQSLQPQPGSTILLGFRMVPKPGWHGYWSNPGDAGIAPTVKWSAPPGVRFGALLHPAPTLISADGISSFVHAGPHILLTRMTVPRSLPRGTAIPLKAELSWAACTATQCVPLHATMSLDLVAGDGARSSDAARLAAAEISVPRQAPTGTFTRDREHIALKLPASLRIDAGRTRFFPDANDSFSTARATAAQADGTVVISGPAGSATAANSISGVVTDGVRSYRLSFARQDIAAPAAIASEAVEHQPAASSVTAAPAVAQRSPASRETPRSPGVPWPWIALAALVAALAALGWWRLRRR